MKKERDHKGNDNCLPFELGSPVHTLIPLRYTLRIYVIYLTDYNYLLLHSYILLDCMFQGF